MSVREPFIEPNRAAHKAKVEALMLKLIALANAEKQSLDVVLDAVLSTYIHTAQNAGRMDEVAGVMLQIGGQHVLQQALARDAAGLTPFENPVVH